jgi:hypothetical protein
MARVKVAVQFDEEPSELREAWTGFRIGVNRQEPQGSQGQRFLSLLMQVLKICSTGTRSRAPELHHYRWDPPKVIHFDHLTSFV